MSSSLHIREVASLDLPELQPYRTLRRPMEHFQMGIFVAEGEKVVRRLLDSDLVVVSLLVTQEWFDRLLPADQSVRQQTYEIFIAEKKLLQHIVGYHVHQGIMAVGRVPPQPSLDEMVSSLPFPHLLVALDGLHQAENVGVITRNCAAFGVDALIVGETSCSPYLRRAVRNSMGTVFRVPVFQAERLVETLALLRHRYNIRLLATDPHTSVLISSADFRGNVCIILGNEDTGVSPQVLSVATQRIAVPMSRETDSLNVASASAVFLYEARKQKSALT